MTPKRAFAIFSVASAVIMLFSLLGISILYMTVIKAPDHPYTPRDIGELTLLWFSLGVLSVFNLHNYIPQMSQSTEECDKRN